MSEHEELLMLRTLATKQAQELAEQLNLSKEKNNRETIHQNCTLFCTTHSFEALTIVFNSKQNFYPYYYGELPRTFAFNNYFCFVLESANISSS